MRANFIRTATNLLRFFSNNRSVGHTYTLVQGLKANPEAKMVVANRKAMLQEPDFRGIHEDRVIGLAGIEKDWIGSMASPMVVDHFLVTTLLNSGLSLINDLWSIVYQQHMEKHKGWWAKDPIDPGYFPRFDMLIVRVNGEPVIDPVFVVMCKDYARDSSGRVFHGKVTISLL